MSASKWAYAWVAKKIKADEYYDAVQTLEMADLIKSDAEAGGVAFQKFLNDIAPRTLEQFLEDVLDDAVNIEDSVLLD